MMSGGPLARRPGSGSALERGGQAQLAQMQIFSGGVARSERALVAGTDGSVEQVQSNIAKAVQAFGLTPGGKKMMQAEKLAAEEAIRTGLYGALGFPSVSNAFEVEVMRADQFLDQLQLYMPKPIRPEDLKVAENLLRLGRPLSGGGIDVVEFCERFELLARNGAAAGSAPPAPVRPPPIPDSDVSKVLLRERPCPIDFSRLGLQQLAEVALRLQREFPDGTAPLYRLVRALEAETKTLPSARQQDQLKKWLEPAPGDALRWPMMLGFEVVVEKLTIMATKELRKGYTQFQLGVSFCGRDLKSRRVPWRMGLMCLSKPSTMEMQPKWRVIFAIDGPDGLTSRELSLALSETPEPPTSHRLRFIIYGVRAQATGVEEVRELGSCELCAGYDLPISDLRPADPRAQRIIEVSAAEAELGAAALTPALRATLQLSTRRAGRLREVAGDPVGRR